MSKARITPGTRSELGLVNWLLGKVVSRSAGVRDANLFSTLGRQRSLFRAWLLFSAHMMPGGKLSRHETELVILRVATLRDCQYELDHHKRIGRRFGIDRALLAEIERGPEAPTWSPRQRALLAGVDQLVRSKDLDDTSWSALQAYFNEAQLIELCLLVGQYEMLATTITALRIERDF